MTPAPSKAKAHELWFNHKNLIDNQTTCRSRGHMKLSHRITTLTPSGSDGWEVFYKARKMKAEGKDITELTIGEHDIRTHPSILDAMSKSAIGGHTGYAMVRHSYAKLSPKELRRAPVFQHPLAIFLSHQAGSQPCLQLIMLFWMKVIQPCSLIHFMPPTPVLSVASAACPKLYLHIPKTDSSQMRRTSRTRRKAPKACLSIHPTTRLVLFIQKRH